MKTYLAYDGRFYKIGRSKNPLKRIQNMKTSNPSIRLVCCCDMDIENKLHRKLKNQRLDREWFVFHKEHLDFVIDKMQSSGGYIEYDQVSQIETNPRTIKNKNWDHKIPFGKFKGRLVSTMSTDREISYMKWYLSTCTPKKLKENHTAIAFSIRVNDLRKQSIENKSEFKNFVDQKGVVKKNNCIFVSKEQEKRMDQMYAATRNR